MRRLTIMAMTGVLLASPALASERDDAIDAIAIARAPECALPVSLLSTGDIERCRRNLATARMIYVLSKDKAPDQIAK